MFSFQVSPIKEVKVLQTFVLHIDEVGNTMMLCEILHTTRNFLGYLQCFQFIDMQLSKLKPDGPGGIGSTMTMRNMLPGFTMTDKDLASLNALSVCFNGMK
jgi:hypothetical protein